MKLQDHSCQTLAVDVKSYVPTAAKHLLWIATVSVETLKIFVKQRKGVEGGAISVLKKDRDYPPPIPAEPYVTL